MVSFACKACTGQILGDHGSDSQYATLYEQGGSKNAGVIGGMEGNVPLP